MNPEIAALLTVQDDDARIRDIEAEAAVLAPRLAQLQASTKQAADEIARGETMLDKELGRARKLEETLTEYRTRLERFSAVLDAAHSLREATAASAQVEAAKRSVAETESELLTANRRVLDQRTALSAHKEVHAERLAAQQEVQATLVAQQQAIASRLADARAVRAKSAALIGASLLARYERVSTKRRAAAVFALRDFCCSACDTAISMQRRPFMASGQRIEPCEDCGVLLYQPIAPEASAAGQVASDGTLPG
ncbi:MAG: hypothetical protein IBJ03_12980 [Gemmatimonadaceae bacterium]|nr:hypothetical protein [Gemmatimonadaceae bacterium]